MNQNSKYLFAAVFCVLIFGIGLPIALAATTGYAWGENIGWINFGPASTSVQVTTSGLTGYAWSANYGWINLSPASSGVKNDGSGNLSGSAWGEQTGYIDFSGVVISSSGTFTGQASGTIAGRINFSCDHCNVVTTDWLPPASASSSGNTGTPGVTAISGGGGGGYTAPAETVSSSAPSNPLLAISGGFSAIVNELQRFLSTFAPKATPSSLEITAVPKVAPPALSGAWNLLAPPELGHFVLQPLPKEISLLTEKFPKLKQTFQELGITGAATLPKLQGVQLNLPGLVMPPGIPLAELSPRIKQGIPSEVVFARSADEKIDFNITLSLGPHGELEKTINAVAGSKIRLVVKPQASVQSVRGYLLLRKSENPVGIGVRNPVVNLQAALASLIFQSPPLAQNVSSGTANVEQRLALAEFEYTDADHDGVYTADVQIPNVSGEYDIITLVSYNDPDLGTKEIGLTAVVDPEGYVYEQSGGKQTRIPNATVTLFWLDPATNVYKSWPANQYSQENPQITSILGTYAFLVPAGTYYLAVRAPGYYAYTGQSFEAQTGNQIHENIELRSSNWFAGWDWQATLIVVIVALLLINFYWDRRRGQAMQQSTERS